MSPRGAARVRKTVGGSRPAWKSCGEDVMNAMLGILGLGPHRKSVLAVTTGMKNAAMGALANAMQLSAPFFLAAALLIAIAWRCQ